MNGALITCCFCEKTVARNELWDHIAVDIGYRPFDCATCAQTFVNKAELTEHEIKNGGHKGNYAGKTHGLKEAMIRQIYMQCITPEICGKKGATNEKIGAEVEKTSLSTRLSLSTSRAKKLPKSKNPTKLAENFGRGRNSVNSPLSTPFGIFNLRSKSCVKSHNEHRHRRHQRSKRSTPPRNDHLPSLSPLSAKKSNAKVAKLSAMSKSSKLQSKKPKRINKKSTTKRIANRGVRSMDGVCRYCPAKFETWQALAGHMQVHPVERLNRTRHRQIQIKPYKPPSNSNAKVIGGCIPQTKGKSRILTLESGAQIEYVNVDSDADWETDSDPDDDVELLCTKRSNNNKNLSTANLECKSTEKKKPQKASNFKLRESVKCKKCDAKIVFFSTQSLENHINCIHLKLPLYTCSRCAMEFRCTSSAIAKKHNFAVHGRNSLDGIIDNRPKCFPKLRGRHVWKKYFGNADIGDDDSDSDA